MSRFSSILWILLALAGLIAGIRAGFHPEMPASTAEVRVSARSLTPEPVISAALSAPCGPIRLFVADDAAEREQGLSDHAPLASDEAMLFIFPESGVYSFWMKDMLFSLDMVWIDEGKNVISVSENISPDSYPQLFAPPAPVKYVLEIGSGAARKCGIATGTKLVF